MKFGTFFRTAAGLVIWIGLLIALKSPRWWADPAISLLFGLLVLLPIALSLARKPGEDEGNVHKTAVYLQPFAALITAAAFLIPPGVLAGTLAIAWVPVSALLLISGIMRMGRSLREIEESSIDLALVLLPLSAVLIWADRMDLALTASMHSEPLFMAGHAFYTGSALLLLIGLMGRRVREHAHHIPPYFGAVVIITLASTSAIFIRLDGPAAWRSGTTLLQTGAIAVTGFLLLREAVPSAESSITKFFFLFSGLSGVVSALILAFLVVGMVSKTFLLPPELLAVGHGWLTAAGLLGCGLVGHRLDLATSS